MKDMRQIPTAIKALTSEEERVLRVTKEPCICIDDYTVHQMLTRDPLGFHSHVQKALIRIANKEVTLEIPPKQIFLDPDTLGDFRVMPCRFQDEQTLVKTVKIVGTNTVQEQVPDQITVGKAFALDPQENFISHMIDACLLSSARTGICAVQAMVTLGNTLEKLTIIGAGRVGFYTALYAAALGGVKEIVFCDQNSVRADQCVLALETKYPELRFSAEKRQALKDTDVLVLATTSRTPVYSASDFYADLVISLGADTDYQHELEADLIAQSDIYVESMDSIRYGDIRLWLDQGRIDKGCLTALFSLLKSGTPVNMERQRLFVSTGSALFDNLAIAYLLREYKNENDYN